LALAKMSGIPVAGGLGFWNSKGGKKIECKLCIQIGSDDHDDGSGGSIPRLLIKKY